MYLVDTVVLSELRKPQRGPRLRFTGINRGEDPVLSRLVCKGHSLQHPHV